MHKPKADRLSPSEYRDSDETSVAQPPPAVGPAKPAKSQYRRNLPHFQGHGAPIFVTFSTYARWILPESVRLIVLKHCRHDDGVKMDLYVAVVMPNHVHFVYRPFLDSNNKPVPLQEIVGALKGASAHSVNRTLKRKGAVWQDESFDRVARSWDNLLGKIDYVRHNPVRWGLAMEPDEYPWLWTNPLKPEAP